MKKPKNQISLCAIHQDYNEVCPGTLVTKRSIYGAIQRICQDGWLHGWDNGQNGTSYKKISFSDALWPETL